MTQRKYCSHNVIKGTLEFCDENGEIELKFNGNHSIVLSKGYKIGSSI